MLLTWWELPIAVNCGGEGGTPGPCDLIADDAPGVKQEKYVKPKRKLPKGATEDLAEGDKLAEAGIPKMSDALLKKEASKISKTTTHYERMVDIAKEELKSWRGTKWENKARIEWNRVISEQASYRRHAKMLQEEVRKRGIKVKGL